MKTFKLLTILVIAILAINVNAQIKVESSGNAHISEIIHTEKITTEGISKGKVIIGKPREEDGNDNDYENVVTVEVLGGDDDSRTRGKMCFGDYGSYTMAGMNVFIGEYGDYNHSTSFISGASGYDSDALWLHGKNAIVLTAGGQAGTKIGYSYFVTGSGYSFTFNVPVYYNKTTYISSDKKFKSDIKEIEGSLSKLKKLNGVSYYKNTDHLFVDSSLTKVKEGMDTVTYSEKDFKSKKQIEERNSNNSDSTQREIGLIAQDLQEVYPELVSEGEGGYLYVNYTGLIPVIIEALKEQQETIDAQSEKIKELESIITASDTATSTTKSSRSAIIANTNDSTIGTLKSADGVIENANEEITTNAFLFQNTPNPFNMETEIKYFVPEAATNAALYIFTLQGNLLRTETITAKGNGSIIIDANNLEPGMFVYSLVIDGYEVDTKKMIITE